MAPLACQAPARAPSADAARILAAVAALIVGATAYLSGIRVQRVSLLTYAVAGYSLDLEEAADEIVYLAAEREAILVEPSLFRAAEIVERRLLTSRGIAGAFSVTIEHTTGHPVYVATWAGHAWDGTHREDRTALEDLASWARDMGLRASRVGCEVIATLPPVVGPALARTTPASAPATSSRAA